MLKYFAQETVDKVRAKDNKTYIEAITREADLIYN